MLHYGERDEFDSMQWKGRTHLRADPAHNRRRGAALVVAMAVAAVVLLSTMLLLGSIEGMVSEQVESEMTAQARLSQLAAVQKAADMMEQGALVPGEEPLPHLLANMRTSIQTRGTGRSGPRVIDLDLQARGLGQLVAARGFLAVYSREGRLLLDHLDPEGRRSRGFPVDAGPFPAEWDAVGFREGEYLGAVLSRGGDGCVLTLLGRDGGTTVMEGELPLWREGGNLYSGSYGGEPAVVATNGRNWGHLILPRSGRTMYFWSPPGTSPAVTSDGGLFGSLSPEGVSGLPGPEVVDSYTEDVDGDGRPDLVWVTHNGISCYLEGRDVLVTDSFGGGTPLAWGGLDPWSGLAVLWREAGSGLRWRRLSWNGFVDMAVSGSVFEQAWRGRLYSGDGTVFGAVDGQWCLLHPDGTLSPLCPTDDSYRDEFDGAMGPEVAGEDSGGIRAWMNPAAGSGTTVHARAFTEDGRGRTWLRQDWTFTVYEDEDGEREVYVEKRQ